MSVTGNLNGKRIVLTKHLREHDGIREALELAGAQVLQLPLIEVEAVNDPEQSVEILKGIANYEWIVFASPNGVHYFFEVFFKAFKDIRCFGGARIACVGNQTADAVRALHLEVDLVPEQQTGVALARALVQTGSLPSAYVLWVSGDKVNREAVLLLEGEGEAILDVFEVYRSSLRDLAGDRVAEDFRKAGADGIFFASPSAVESFVSQAKHLKRGKHATPPKSVSIGPTTSEAMKRCSIPVDGESSSPAPMDVVAAFAKVLMHP
jgi:uroporphyrinogen III methyltransferase / synthase